MGSHGSPQNMSIVMNRHKLNSSLSALDGDPDFYSIGPDKQNKHNIE